MKSSIPRTWNSIDTLISALVFLLLLAGVYALLGMAPYMGFYFDPLSGRVIALNVNSANGLQMGDVIKKVGQLTWDEYKRDKYLVLFENSEVYEMTVERGGEEIQLKWRLPGFNAGEFMGRFFSTWWLSFFFWFFGFATHRYIRPRDLAWRLLVALNYLIAVFIAFGNVSAFHILGSLFWMRAAVWLMTPVILQLHWIFPTPLRSLPAWVWNGLYLLFGTLAVLEVLPSPSLPPYFLGLLLAFLGAPVLLIIHYIRQPSGRSDIRLLGVALLVAVLPIVSVSLAGVSGWIPAAAPLSFFTLALLPGTYVYAINRRRMGKLELRASRAISAVAYLFLLLFILPFVMLVMVNLGMGSQDMGAQDSGLQDLSAVYALLFSLAITVLTIYLFPRFQELVERRMLGITLPYKNILEIYSNKIASSATQADLVALLEKDIFSSLQVQQYAFIVKDGADKVTLLSKNVSAEQVQMDEAMDLIDEGRAYRLLPPSTVNAPLDWIRLILPLKVKTGIIGVWLLGRRDPDDLYPQADLPIIQSLSSQTAIALSNILQTERLKSMYQANVDRYEKERMRLALDLHDSVLNETAALLMFLDPSAQTPKFQAAYDNLVRRLREIVTELRPPMLNYGFKFGLDELADNLSELHKDLVRIDLVVEGNEETHYPQSVEHHIYRMVQEACENAVRHGQAGHIRISGSLNENCIDLAIEDDGIGFDAEGAKQLDRLVAKKHFGLAGMLERAELIGAEVRFRSLPERGTRVTIGWKASQ